MKKGIRLSSMALAVMMAVSLFTGAFSMNVKASDVNTEAAAEVQEEVQAGTEELEPEIPAEVPAETVGSEPAFENGESAVPAEETEADAEPVKTEDVPAEPTEENGVPAEEEDPIVTGDMAASAAVTMQHSSITGVMAVIQKTLTWPGLLTPDELDRENIFKAKDIAKDVIAGLDGNVTNSTTAEDILGKIREAFHSNGLGDAVEVTMETWNKNESDADNLGTIDGTVHFQAGSRETWTAFYFHVPKDSTPKFDEVINALTEALEGAVLTNDTTQEEVMKILQGALPKGVSAVCSGFYVQTATDKAEGILGGNITLTSSRGVYEWRLETAAKIPVLPNRDMEDILKAKDIIKNNIGSSTLLYSDSIKDDILKMLQEQIESTGVNVSWNKDSVQIEPADDKNYIMFSGTLLLQKGDASESMKFSASFYKGSTTEKYEFTEGSNSVWYLDTDTKLFFALSGEPYIYTELRVDGIILDRADYAVDSYGKAEFSLLPHFLQRLGSGIHTMEAFYDGGVVKTTFTIMAKAQEDLTKAEQKPNPEPVKKEEQKEEKKESESPKTGDPVNAGVLWAAVLLSGAGAAALYRKKRYE